MEYVLFVCLIILIFFVVGLRNSFMDRFDRLERELSRWQEEARRVSPPPSAESKPEPVRETEPFQPHFIRQPEPSGTQPAAPRPVSRGQEPPRPGFFERHPDLEKFIGENLVSKIGIAILVLAIGFFVKYAIDNNWVGPAGRVGIGILCGGILIGIAH